MNTNTPDNLTAEPSHWERRALETLLAETLKEQRRARRWRVFFRLTYLLAMIGIIYLLLPSRSTSYDATKPHTALVTLKGELMDEGDANAKDINEGLEDAFANPNTKAVLLEINSPGGSPVQAGEIYDNIVRLKKEYPQIKLYAVCTDMCASGAYYVAAAADYIYADKASLVGSIGVLMNGFGFVDTINKLGVQRRLMTAGSEKGFMDPFSPTKPEDQQYMQEMLNIIHQQFIDAVKTGRGPRLKESPLTFSGLVWTGQQATDLGLIDGLATPDHVVRNIIKETNVVDYSVEGNFFKNLSSKVGSSAAKSTAALLGIHSGLLQ
jgi:protease-4